VCARTGSLRITTRCTGPGPIFASLLHRQRSLSGARPPPPTQVKEPSNDWVKIGAALNVVAMGAHVGWLYWSVRAPPPPALPTEPVLGGSNGSPPPIVAMGAPQCTQHCLLLPVPVRSVDKQQSIWQMDLYAAAPNWLPFERCTLGKLRTLTGARAACPLALHTVRVSQGGVGLYTHTPPCKTCPRLQRQPRGKLRCHEG
jgi:hypothetical protein